MSNEQHPSPWSRDSWTARAEEPTTPAPEQHVQPQSPAEPTRPY